MSDHISVLSDQNEDLVGHMSFQERKIICIPACTYNCQTIKSTNLI